MREMRCIIADDEPLARKLLRSMLATYDDVEIVAECANGVEALQAIQEKNADVAFLDINMPGLDGLQLVESASESQADLPAIVFVTAFDEHAVRAFRMNALDYLLKPFDEDRLHVTIDRLRQRAMGEAPNVDTTALVRLFQELQMHAPMSRLVVRTGDRAQFLPVDQVHWIEADGKHVRVHTAREAHVQRETLNQMADLLDSRQFLRVSRSAIVNLAEVREIQPWFRGDYVLILRSGVKIPSTRTYREGIEKILERGAL